MEAIARRLAAETEVRVLLDSYFDAVRATDLARITAHYARDIVAYDATTQLEFSGLEAYRAHWKSCLDMCRNMVFEPREPTVAASGDLAFGHYLVRCGGTGPDGMEQTSWSRSTFAARKENGRWLIVHEHFSIPFDPMSGNILDGLEPQDAGAASAA